MDDLTISTTTHVQARWVITALDDPFNWARLKFKPNKSRSLVNKKGKVSKRFNLQVQEEDIPSIMDRPIKCTSARGRYTIYNGQTDGRPVRVDTV